MHSSDSADNEPELGFERFAGITGEDSSDTSGNTYQEGWIISYIDILTLLLTLFVILLAMSHFKSDTSSLDQFENNLSKSEKSSPQSKQKKSSDNIRVATVHVTQIEQKPEKHKEVTGSVTNQEKIQIDKGDVEQQSISMRNIAKPESILTDTSVLQQKTETPISDEYLNIEAAKLFDTQIDIARILPVHPAFNETNDQMAASEQSNPDGDTSDAPVSAIHAQPIVPFSDERTALMAQINNLQLGDQIEINAVQDHVNLEISDHVLFTLGSADLKPEGLNLLEQLAVMVNNTKLNISIEGHTDSVPINNAQFPSNWELSTARATMVTRHLIDNNIAPYRIRAIGYADTRPRADNETKQGRERNRRVSIILHMPEARTHEDTLAALRH
jgi:chemotaxis protein MotB